MASSGRPLRKFGTYQVRQSSNGKNAHWTVTDLRGDRFFVHSSVKESANLAADRLSQGLPVYTPKGAMDFSLEVYPQSNPSKFDYYNHTYLSCGRFEEWVNGGPLGRDVTDLSPEGRSYLKSKNEELKEDTARFSALLVADGLTEEDIFGPSAKTIQSWYRQGTWPDIPAPVVNPPAPFRPFRTGNFLRPIYSSGYLPPLGILATSGGALNPTEEWLEDARAASTLVFSCGENQTVFETVDSKSVLTKWIEALESNFGGKWR